MKKAYLIAALSGISWALSAAPRNFPPIGFLGAPLLLVAIELGQQEKMRARAAFALGLLSGFSCNVVVLGWVVSLLQVFGHFPLIGAIPVGSLLWLAQGLPFAFAALATHLLTRFEIPTWVSLPATITIATVLTPALFPWHIATSQVPFTQYIQLAEVGGTPILDFLLALCGCAAWAAYRQKSMRIAALSVAAFALPVIYGFVRLPMLREARAHAPITRVGVAQPNVGIDEKHDPRLAWDQLERLRAITRTLEADGAALVLWPETAYPFSLPHEAVRDLPGPDGLLHEGVHGPLLFGSITQEDDRVYNSAVAMLSNGDVTGVSDKVELLAFGEYVPLWDVLPPLQQFFRRRGISAGDSPRVLTIGNARMGVLICYEDVLDMHSRRVAQSGPDFLVNLTNDAWFGETEPFLHESVARFRAVETRRDLVRAVNTGVSSHISYTGEELVATPIEQQRSFVAEVRSSDTVTLWTRFGDVTTPTLAAWLAIWVLRNRRRQRSSAAKTEERQ